MTENSVLSEYELIVLLKKGDQTAYTTLYDRYSKLLFSHAYQKIGDPDVVQDVLQDVFLNLWNNRAQLSENDNLSGYLYTAVRNKTLNIIAHSKVRDVYATSILEYSQSGSITTDHLIRERQFAELIEKEIAALPEKMREIFLLSRKGHLKNRQIAEQLNLSEHTVATQIKRAIRILKDRLGPLAFLCMLLYKDY